MTSCAIMQPTYLPWLGYFDLIEKSDVFIFLDHVQFSRQSWQQRNKIRDKRGEIMLTVPIVRSEISRSMIVETKIDASKNSMRKHIASIRQHYTHSKNYAPVLCELEGIYSKNHCSLAELNIDLIRYGCQKMGLCRVFLNSSAMDVGSSRIEGLIEMCAKVGADHYYSPAGACRYIFDAGMEKFQRNGIKISYQNYQHPIYAQCNYTDFVSHLSFIDYLFNV